MTFRGMFYFVIFFFFQITYHLFNYRKKNNQEIASNGTLAALGIRIWPSPPEHKIQTPPFHWLHSSTYPHPHSSPAHRVTSAPSSQNTYKGDQVKSSLSQCVFSAFPPLYTNSNKWLQQTGAISSLCLSGRSEAERSPNNNNKKAEQV